MSKILSNYKRETKLVLVNDENNVVAIIGVKKSTKAVDITEKVKLAIKEELLASDVVFSEDINISEFGGTTKVPFIYNDGDDEEFNVNWELIKTEQY